MCNDLGSNVQQQSKAQAAGLAPSWQGYNTVPRRKSVAEMLQTFIALQSIMHGSGGHNVSLVSLSDTPTL